MREILFRGKQVFFNDWIEGTGIFNDGINTWLSFNEPEKAIAYGLNHKIVHAETVGQYTGLTDKNGKKIFEGDILCDDNEKNGVVEFAEGEYNIVFSSFCEYALADISRCYYVIGNIHDNPELLGGEP